MNSAITRVGLAIIVFLSIGCSSKDNSEPPALLTEIKQSIPLDLLWSVNTDAAASLASYNLRPLLVEDQIMSINTAGEISNIDAKSGRTNWRVDTGIASISGLAGNQSILVASSGDGELTLFDRLENGLEKRWSIQLKGEIRAAAALATEQIFVRTVSGKLTAISLVDGSIQWSLTRRIPALTLTGNSSPLVDGDRVIVGFDDGKMAAYERANGQLIWETTISLASGRSEIERLVDIDGQFLLKDGVIYVSSYQGNLAAVQAINGNVLWSRKFSAYQAIVADDEALYLSGELDHIWSIDRRSGSAFWKQDVLHARKITAPQILNDKIAVADLEGYVHWFDKTDGSLKGRLQPSTVRHVAQPLLWQDSVIVFDGDGQLSAIKPL